MNRANRKSGLTLVEVLGAATVVLTVATVSMVSIKGTVAAGQKATAQRELQGLNSTLNTFKGAGGVIPDGATAEQALQALRDGTDLAGADYSPLVSEPPLSMEIGGEQYNLVYDPETGFSYQAADGLGLFASGEDQFSPGGVGYPFDITSPAAVAQALETFKNIDPNSPMYQDYLNAFNAAKEFQTLPQSSLDSIDKAMGDAGLVSVNQQWQRPIFDFTNPQSVTEALAQAPSYRGTESYQNYIASLNAALSQPGADPLAINSGLQAEFLAAVRGRNEDALTADWSKVSLEGITSLAGLNLAGTNVTGEQLNALSDLSWVRLHNMDLTGFDPTGKNLFGVQFNNATGITVAQLLAAANLNAANLTGLDFAGASFAGRSITHLTINNPKNFDGSALNGATLLQRLNLSGTDLTNFDPTSISSWGEHGSFINFNNSTLSQSALDYMFNHTSSARMPVRFASFEGVDMTNTRFRSDLFVTNLTNVVGISGANFVPENRTICEARFGQLDMTGFPYENIIFRGTQLQDVKNMTGADLNRIRGFQSYIWPTNLSNRDLTGWQPTYPIPFVNLTGVTGITAESLVNSTDLRKLRLTGTGITKEALEAALRAAGKDPTTENFDTSTIIF
jgi:uncharacterized protein YjbI with pentapeptide repeats